MTLERLVNPYFLIFQWRLRVRACYLTNLTLHLDALGPPPFFLPLRIVEYIQRKKSKDAKTSTVCAVGVDATFSFGRESMNFCRTFLNNCWQLVNGS